MLDFKKFLVISIILDFLDSLSTYYYVSSGWGREANPVIAAQINANPGFVFTLFSLYVVVAMAGLAAFSRLYPRLPAPYRAWVDKYVSLAAVTAVGFKTAVIINNVLGIAVGFTPIAYLFEKIGLFK
jgi:hypothetical protein